MDLLEEMGAELPRSGKAVECGQKAPRAPRHTTWHNAATFTFTGWVALMRVCHCKTCGATTRWLDGVFTVEVCQNGSRRLTRATDWPAQGMHACEMTRTESDYCGECIRELGFRAEVDAPRVFTLIAGEGSMSFNAQGRRAGDAREQARIVNRSDE